MDGLAAQIAANCEKLVTASYINTNLVYDVVNKKWIKDHGHIATVIANYGIYDPRLGQKISQAGSVNGEMWLKDKKAFGNNASTKTKYYEMISDSQYLKRILEKNMRYY